MGGWINTTAGVRMDTTLHVYRWVGARVITLYIHGWVDGLLPLDVYGWVIPKQCIDGWVNNKEEVSWG